jgi:hypothetical protein
VALASGCGGTEQDAHEPRGTFAVKVLEARFPSRQSISHPERLVLKVRNTGKHTVPNLAVSVHSFYYTSDYPELAANQRPVWIVDQGPGKLPHRPVKTATVDPAGAGQTAYVNTWALGPLAAGATQIFEWRVTPVKAGTHSVDFAVAAGLDGKALARTAANAAPAGRFLVRVAPKPAATHVDPVSGKVLAGAPPTPAGPVGVAP